MGVALSVGMSLSVGVALFVGVRGTFVDTTFLLMVWHSDSLLWSKGGLNLDPPLSAESQSGLTHEKCILTYKFGDTRVSEAADDLGNFTPFPSRYVEFF